MAGFAAALQTRDPTHEAFFAHRLSIIPVIVVSSHHQGVWPNLTYPMDELAGTLASVEEDHDIALANFVERYRVDPEKIASSEGTGHAPASVDSKIRSETRVGTSFDLA